MKRDLIKPLKSSFLSCEKDTQRILEKLFIDNRQHGNTLKKLLVISAKDCIDNPKYDEKVREMSLKDLFDEQYIKLNPKIKMPEHEDIKSYVIISFDNFTPNATNPEFRDCTVTFDIICHSDYWDIGNYRQRPLKIAGYIDGLLNDCKLTGIGTFQFLGCNELVLSEDLSGYSLTFIAVHGSDDTIPDSEE